jgi:NADH-quinone oxidoreductase subunit H
MLLMSAFYIILFFGGWTLPFICLNYEIFYIISFSFKLSIICYIFILVRASFPRYRYDQLMDIGWKVFLPLTLSYVIFTGSILIYFEGLPCIL